MKVSAFTAESSDFSVIWKLSSNTLRCSVRSTTATPRFLFIHFSVNVATSQDMEPHTPNERMQKTSQLEIGSSSLNRSIIEMGSHHEPKRGTSNA
jgi:hypothetical protein